MLTDDIYWLSVNIMQISIFPMNYHTQELAGTLEDVKKSIDEIKKSQTLQRALGTLLSIGNFLNGTKV